MCLLNKAAVRDRILREFQTTRPDAGITRVSAQALRLIEARVEAIIVQAVQHHPSIGKTFTEVG